MFVWKRPKINEKEAGDGPFKKKYAVATFGPTFGKNRLIFNTSGHTGSKVGRSSREKEVSKV